MRPALLALACVVVINDGAAAVGQKKKVDSRGRQSTPFLETFRSSSSDTDSNSARSTDAAIMTPAAPEGPIGALFLWRASDITDEFEDGVGQGMAFVPSEKLPSPFLPT